MNPVEQDLYDFLPVRIPTTKERTIFVCYVDGNLADVESTTSLGGFKNRVRSYLKYAQHDYRLPAVHNKITDAEATKVITQWMKDHCVFKEIKVT